MNRPLFCVVVAQYKLAISTVVCTPHTPKQCLVCKYLARIQCQLLQQTELCRGELDAFAYTCSISLYALPCMIPDMKMGKIMRER